MTLQQIKDDMRKNYTKTFQHSHIWEDAKNNRHSISNDIVRFIDTIIYQAYKEGAKSVFIKK